MRRLNLRVPSIVRITGAAGGHAYGEGVRGAEPKIDLADAAATKREREIETGVSQSEGQAAGANALSSLFGKPPTA